MVERPTNAQESNNEALPEEVRTRALFVLSRLGIGSAQVADLKGKRLLDIGAGSAEAVRFLRSQGCDAVAVDIVKQDNMKSVPWYVIADATKKLPYPDDSFDSVLVHANPVFDTTEGIAAYAEAMRILKNGCELRVGPAFSPKDSGDPVNVAAEELTRLKNNFPNAVMSNPVPSSVPGYYEHYFTIRK